MTLDIRDKRRRESCEDNSDCPPERRHRRRRRSRQRRSRSYRMSHPREEHTPQAPPTEQIFIGSDDLGEFVQEQHRWELAQQQRPSQTRPAHNSRRKWCMFYKECGHSTEDYRALRAWPDH
ncbi:hypothetical protein Dimus_038990 [Dionaea muscipula]